MINPVNTLWDEFKDTCQRYLDLIPTRLIATGCKQPGFPYTFDGYPIKTTYVQLCKIITISILLVKISIAKK